MHEGRAEASTGTSGQSISTAGGARRVKQATNNQLSVVCRPGRSSQEFYRLVARPTPRPYVGPIARWLCCLVSTACCHGRRSRSGTDRDGSYKYLLDGTRRCP